jgi:RNA polymerase primary sigma factor
LELSKAAKIKFEKIHKLHRLAQRDISLEHQLGDDPQSKTLVDFIEDKNATSPAQSVFGQLRAEKLVKLINNLSEKEKKVIQMRFGFDLDHPHTLEQTGQTMGVTRERIRQIEEKALQKIRSLIKSRQQEYHELLTEFV